jgi:hypothetical protein
MMIKLERTTASTATITPRSENGPGIEGLNAGDVAGVYHDPHSHECKVKHNKDEASDKGSDCVDETLRNRPAFECLFLLLHNRIYVRFGVSGVFSHEGPL